MVLLGSLVLATLTASCDPSAATVLAADKLFAAADTAVTNHDTSAAKAAYDAGMQQLAATPWFIETKACDPPQYTFERYVVTLHSLMAGENTGAIDVIKAFTTETDMWNGITHPSGAPPNSAGPAVGAFMTRYPDLFAQMSSYETALRTRYNTAQLARHTPAAANCAEPNIPVELVQTSPLFFDTLQQSMQLVAKVPRGHYIAVVDVAVAEDGKVQGAHIAQSSGQRAVDDEALRETTARGYLPEIKDCRRVASIYTYDFSVNTTPDAPYLPDIPGLPH